MKINTEEIPKNKMMKCNKCNINNSGEGKFCVNCGSELTFNYNQKIYDNNKKNINLLLVIIGLSIFNSAIKKGMYWFGLPYNIFSTINHSLNIIITIVILFVAISIKGKTVKMFLFILFLIKLVFTLIFIIN